MLERATMGQAVLDVQDVQDVEDVGSVPAASHPRRLSRPPVGGNAGAKPYIGDGGDVYRVLIIG